MHHKKRYSQESKGIAGLTKKTIMLWPEQLAMLGIVNETPVSKPFARRFSVLP